MSYSQTIRRLSSVVLFTHTHTHTHPPPSPHTHTYISHSLPPPPSPLPQGCLKPVQVLIPERCLLDPSDTAAVVGGNVLTCQRIVDVVFKAFSTCAASQGCMNNITFGDESVGYYETVAGGAGAVSICTGGISDAYYLQLTNQIAVFHLVIV